MAVVPSTVRGVAAVCVALQPGLRLSFFAGARRAAARRTAGADDAAARRGGAVGGGGGGAAARAGAPGHAVWGGQP